MAGDLEFARRAGYVSGLIMPQTQTKFPRIAVLGCGYWGSNHIRTLKSLGALQAVSDSNPARA